MILWSENRTCDIFMENIAGLKFSVVSGLLAAFSGFFGKITFDSKIVDTISSKLQVGVRKVNWKTSMPKKIWLTKLYRLT